MPGPRRRAVVKEDCADMGHYQIDLLALDMAVLKDSIDSVATTYHEQSTSRTYRRMDPAMCFLIAAADPRGSVSGREPRAKWSVAAAACAQAAHL